MDKDRYTHSTPKMNRDCNKGYSCGKACINRDKSCQLDMDEDSIDFLDKVVDLIVSAPKSTAKKTGDDLMRPEMAKAYLKFLNGGEKLPPKIREISEKTLDKVWNALPAKVKTDLRQKGAPCNRSDSAKPMQCSAPAAEQKAWLEERGRFVLKELIDYDFTDPITGDFTSWRQLQPDHIIPMSKLGGKEVLSNLNLVHKQYNQNKNAFPEETLRKNLEVMANRSEEEYNTELAKAGQKNNAKAEKEQAWKDNLEIMPNDVFASTVNSSKPGDLKAVLKALANGGSYRGFYVGGRSEYGKSGSMQALALLARDQEINDAQKQALISDLEKDQSKAPSKENKLKNILSKYKLNVTEGDIKKVLG